MTQKNTKTDNTKTVQPPQPPQTVKCFVMPADAMDRLRDVLKTAPFKEANPMLQYLATLQVMDVPLNPVNTVDD